MAKAYKRVGMRKPQKGKKQLFGRKQAKNILAPGVGKVPKQVIGTKEANDLRVWDATLPHHLALPRAVGPYLTVRSTRRFSSNARAVVCGPTMVDSDGRDRRWSSIVAFEDVDATAPINGASNAIRHTIPNIGTSGLTWTPSAFTVQVMNPNPLQTTEGIVYLGVMKTRADLNDNPQTWDAYFDRFISYQAPRMMAAARLALKGVQINSYPLSMSHLSDFTDVANFNDATTTLTTANGSPDPEGWAPILVNNVNGVDLEYLITVEWRVRFSLTNPASSAHVHHNIASDNTWNTLMAKASALGNGVRDIAEFASNVGQAARTVRSVAALV